MDISDFLSDIDFDSKEEYDDICDFLSLVQEYNDSNNNGLFYIDERFPFLSQRTRNLIFHCTRKHKVNFVFDNEIALSRLKTSVELRRELARLLTDFGGRNYVIGRTDKSDFKNYMRNSDVDFCFYLSKTTLDVLGKDKLILNRSDMIILNIWDITC